MSILLPDGDEYITSAEVCAILNCHRTILERYFRAGTAPSGTLRLGRNRLWRKSGVYKWLLCKEEAPQ